MPRSEGWARPTEMPSGKSECIAFPDLLSEGVHRLEIEDFPVVVAIDADGGSIYGKRT